MRWSKKEEADGVWNGPLQVIIQEDQRVVWVTQGNKLYRIAPEHLRPLSAVQEWRQGVPTESESLQVNQGQSVFPRHGMIQFHHQAVPSNNHNTNNRQSPNHNHQSTSSQDSQEQPDQEPEEGANPSEIPSNSDVSPNDMPSTLESEIKLPYQPPIQ